MKITRLFFLALFATAFVCQAQPITNAGWYDASLLTRTPPTTPDGEMMAFSEEMNDGYELESNVNEPSTAIAEAITPDIQALARGLENDPLRIFNYVHDHIRYVHHFGSKKGAALTLLEKSGNDFDQSALLVALLRAAGQTNVGYQFGMMLFPYDIADGTHRDLHHWLQLSLNNTNWNATSNCLYNLLYTRGYPTYAAFYGNNVFAFQHVWVTLKIGATTYQLDPSFKVSEYFPGINLQSAMGFSSNGVWTAAAGTETTTYVTNLNEAALRGTLAGYTTNLLNWIRSNAPNSDVQGLVSGWQITPSTNTALPTNLLFTIDDFSGTMPVQAWINQPTNMMAGLTITFAGTNYSWRMPQLAGQRVTLTFATNGSAQLWQEDNLLRQATTTNLNNTTEVGLAVDHPIGYWDFNNNDFVDVTDFDSSASATYYQRTNPSTYVIQYAFEPDWGWLRKRQNQLAAYRSQGLSPTSREVVSETLNVMGLNWMLQTEAAEAILAAQLNILPQNFHRLGRVGQETGRGYFVDVFMQLSSPQAGSGQDFTSLVNRTKHRAVKNYFSSALEHGVIEQMQSSNLVAASTVKMLQIANTNHQAVYVGYYDNWTTGSPTVRDKLINYGATNMADLDYLVSQGYFLVLPQNGSNHVAGGAGTWAGYGYVANGGGNMAMLIGGNYYGGIAATTGSADSAYIDKTSQSQPGAFSSTATGTPNLTAGDPVNMADGTFQTENTDLSIGQAEPRGLKFTRYYNGTRRNSNPAAMADGWIHNYYANAIEVSAPEAGLGATTPAQAAPMIAAICSAIGLHDPLYASPKNWTVTALIAKWGIDQLNHNGVSVTAGKDTLQFVKQPNGVFTPPANCTFTLLKTNSVYWLQERHGNTFKFNAAGLLTNIVDQYNQPLTLTYNPSNWVSQVKDWKNRTFTFNYSVPPSRLTSVVDDLSRSVTLGYSTAYNSQGDLTSVTDPENKTSTFIYDTNHQITAVFDAANRLVVTNIYDGMGHVATQYTEGDTNKTWQIYWSGWQTVSKDPAGGRQDYFYDDQRRLVQRRDPLTNNSYVLYDGQNHVALTISPMLEVVSYVYDGNHNLTNAIDALGFTNRYVYGSQNNLLRSIDARGKTNNFGYNAKFQLTGSTNGAGDWVLFTYDPTDGTLSTRVDSGGTVSYSYDANGQLSGVSYPGSLRSEGYLNNSLGDVLSRTNGRGFVTSFQYNSLRELTNTIAPTNLTASIAYDAVGNVASTTNPRRFTTTNAWSATRKLLITSLPATPQGTPVITNGYDARDWLIRTFHNLPATIIYTNDVAGRLIAVTDPLLRTTKYSYDADGRKTGITNAALEVTKQNWSARGELTKVINPATNTVGRGYDPAGNQTTLTNRNGKKWQFQFDGANRLTNTISPLNRTHSQTWNNRGLVDSLKEPSGDTATLTYDAKGRLSNRTDSIGAITYRYDANNNVTNIVEAGKTNTWTFDAYDRASTYKDADANLIQYGYDANGNLTNLVYPGGRSVAYAYDSLNRLTNVTDWANQKTTFYYDLASRLTTIIRPNGTTRTIGYDAAGQATNIVEKMAIGVPISFFRLNWNTAARVQWEFTAPLPHAYTNVTRTMYFDADNRMTNFNGQVVSYDPDGNMTNGPLTNNTLTSYTYDARNRLLSAGGVDYAYDPAGNRVGVTNGGTATRFVVNPNAPLSQALMRVKGGTTNYYIYGLGLLYEVTETASGTNTLTYHYDYRGSTIALSGNNGIPTDRMEYSAYGSITYRAGTNDTPFLFNGRYGVQTDVNGLLNMRARYYNPHICRFVNPDPAGFAAGLNFYAYADGNPVSLIDPFGLGEIALNEGASLLTRGEPCVMCHGVSAFGFNGDINAFSGLTTIPGVTPQQALTMDRWADSLQEHGPQLLSDIGTAEIFLGTGLASPRATARQVSEPQPTVKPLPPGPIPPDTLIPIAGKPGQFIRYGDIPYGHIINAEGYQQGASQIKGSTIGDLMNLEHR